MGQPVNSVIESLGVYLPPRKVSSEEILAGCAENVRFPLERLTGIATRRMAGDGEYAIHLAELAIRDCLRHSRRSPEDIELLVCCNISRYDGPRRFSYEPTTAIQLRHRFGLKNALTFDVSNACAGMFTGVYLVDSLIRAGAIQCGLVVSGEYITHLTRTAQKEIRGFMDPQLASLTLGDAGAALILEAGKDGAVGFHQIDLYTLAEFAELCVAKPTDKEHGGAAMKLDPLRAAELGSQPIIMHVNEMLRQSGRPLESFTHVIPHQTSRTTIREALREIARLTECDLSHAMIDNLQGRGNTATTSHFVAVRDQVRNGRIQPGDDTLFFVSGSGMTVGAAVYTFDDLPERLCNGPGSGKGKHRSPPADSQRRQSLATPNGAAIRIESLGVALCKDSGSDADTRELAARAAEECFARSSYDRRQIDVLIYVGVYRTELIAEPAAAAFAALDLKTNHRRKSLDDPRTFAFDVLNGPCGVLTAQRLAAGLIQAGRAEAVMILAAECPPQVGVDSDRILPPAKAGSAVILDRSPDPALGFSSFYNRCFTEHLDASEAFCALEAEHPYLVWKRAPDWEDRWLRCVEETVHECLRQEGEALSDLALVIPPQISPGFVDRCGKMLGVDKRRIVDVTQPDADLLTSSSIHALEAVRRNELAQPGDRALITNVGAGVQAACTIYTF